MRRSARVWSAWFGFFSLLASGCGFGLDSATESGRAAIVRAAKNALNRGDCSTAIQLIEPLYQSVYVTNEIRLVRASAHGCGAGIEFFELALSLANVGSLSGAQFFRNMTQTFPSTLGADSAFESAMLAMDSVQATVIPGRTLNSLFTVNGGTFNPGSLLAGDRMPDANFFMIFVGMSLIGTAQNRYGAPDASFNKTQDLPWSRSNIMDTDGCAYVSGLVNMADAMSASASYATEPLRCSLDLAGQGFNLLVNGACELGCLNLNVDLTPAGDAACNFAAGTCATCPIALKSRTGCLTSLQASCAAAGIVRLINDDATNGWPPDL